VRRLRGDLDFADLFRALQKAMGLGNVFKRIRAMAGFTVPSSSLNRWSLGGSTERA
jgi:hypothetical protein